MILSASAMPRLLYLPLLAVILIVLAHGAWGQTAAAPQEIAGLKKELYAGITEADFLTLGPEPKSAKVILVATFTAENYGMNFDGYSHGKAVFTIPTGWKVDVTFINPGPVPHSAVVVDRDAVRKLQVGDPAFPGAATPNAVMGLSLSKANFSFVASEAGDYAFACGFPSHAAGGHWVALQVSNEAKVPTLKLGDAPAVEARGNLH